ncbi:ras-related protein Rab-33A isoform X2 [Cavia porcellus]|uniref:ras-related protein Rab-33A isoform X2 n=1 Tax=Cavia porcellus TaxID=10141 RepID=UPI002FE0C94A
MAQPILGHGSLQPSSATGLASVELDSSLDQYVQIRIFKIIVIGDSNVGKTCLTFRFCGGTFPDKTEATIGVDFREKTVEIEGEKIKVRQLPRFRCGTQQGRNASAKVWWSITTAMFMQWCLCMTSPR